MNHHGEHKCQPIKRTPLCEEARSALQANSHLRPREVQWQVSSAALQDFLQKKKSWGEATKIIDGLVDLRSISNEKQKVGCVASPKLITARYERRME